MLLPSTITFVVVCIIKHVGKQKYLFASLDDQTCYWLASDMMDTKFQHNADTLLEMIKKTIGKTPKHFIINGLPAYMNKDTRHSRHIHLCRDMNNNKIERLNEKIRDREKVYCGLKKIDTLIIDGMRAHYNFTKKHGGLGGKTPTEARPNTPQAFTLSMLCNEPKIPNVSPLMLITHQKSRSQALDKKLNVQSRI